MLWSLPPKSRSSPVLIAGRNAAEECVVELNGGKEGHPASASKTIAPHTGEMSREIIAKSVLADWVGSNDRHRVRLVNVLFSGLR